MGKINNNRLSDPPHISSEDTFSDETPPNDSWVNSFYCLAQKSFANDRFFWVLLNLLLLAIIFPSLDHAKSGDDILALFFAFFLFSVPYALRNNDEATRFIYFFSLPFCLFGCALLILPDNLLGLTHPKWVILPRMISHMIFFFSLAFYLFRELWLDKAIGFDKIIGGCCLYLIVGMIWGYIYGMVEEFSPGSFAVANMQFLDGTDGTNNHHVRGSVLLYFSFITLTSFLLPFYLQDLSAFISITQKIKPKQSKIWKKKLRISQSQAKNITPDITIIKLQMKIPILIAMQPDSYFLGKSNQSMAE